MEQVGRKKFLIYLLHIMIYICTIKAVKNFVRKLMDFEGLDGTAIVKVFIGQ